MENLDSYQKDQLRDRTIALQTELSNQGLEVKVDGILGPETKKALFNLTGTEDPALAKDAIANQFKFTGETEKISVNDQTRQILCFVTNKGEKGIYYIAGNERFTITFTGEHFAINALTEGYIKKLTEQAPTVDLNTLNPNEPILLANKMEISPQFSAILLAMVGATRLPTLNGQPRTVIITPPSKLDYWLDGTYKLTFEKKGGNVNISSTPPLDTIAGIQIEISKLKNGEPYIAKEGNPPTTLTPELVDELLKLS